MIGHKHKFIFIHVPKNAGTSMEDSLSKGIDIFNYTDVEAKYNGHLALPYGHMRQRELGLTMNRHSDYFIWLFCREPIARFKSIYAHSKRHTHGQSVVGSYFKRPNIIV